MRRLPRTDKLVDPGFATRQAAGLALLASFAPEPAAITIPRVRAPAAAAALPLILTVQAVLSLRLAWSNTAFQDEALYLWAGRAEWAHWLHGAPAPQFQGWFSGAPVIYPPLGAAADTIGGLAAARGLSLVLMLAATVLLHGVTRRLYTRRAAGFAAALFAGSAATQFLGAFATYDALALALLAGATWCAVRARDATRPAAFAGLLAATAGCMVAANAAKYASALFDPVVITVAVLAAWDTRGRRVGAVTAATVTGTGAALLAGGVAAGGRGYWQGILVTTLARAPSNVPAAGILIISAEWAGVVALLAVFGATATRGTRPARALAWALAAAVLLAPAEQARIHVVTSLFKHVGYGAWFGCAVAGYALTALARAVPPVKARSAAIAATALALTAAVTGAAVAQSHFRSWPNSTLMLERIYPLLTKGACPCLMMDDKAVRYYLAGRDIDGAIGRISAPYYFQYGTATGLPAYRAAIRAGYFGLIEVDPSENAAIYDPLARVLTQTGTYGEAASIPSGVAGEPFEIWERNR